MGLLRADLYKLARHPLFRWLVLALLIVVLLRGLVWPPAPDVPWTGLWSLGLVVAVLIVLTAITLGQEFGTGTFRSLVGRGVPRWRFLLTRFAALIVVGGILLVASEGLATWLGVRRALHWDDLWRAWLSLPPYVSMMMFLTVLARNGGPALLIGLIQLSLEQFHGILMAPLVTYPEAIPSAWRIFTHEGLGGTLYQWSLSYSSANWIYRGAWQRAPTPLNVLMQAMPHSPIYSASLLAGCTLLGLGLSLVVVYARDVTDGAEDESRVWSLVVPWAAWLRRPRLLRRGERLPSATGRGSLLIRLVRAYLFQVGRTRLLRAGAMASLLFPLALWGIAEAMDASGFENLLFSPGPGRGAPLGFVVGLLLVGPLVTVVSLLAVSNDLSLGTRRAMLARGVSRLQAIAGQSLALMLVLGGVVIVVAFATLLIAVAVTGTWYVGPAAQTVLVGVLATGAYVAAVQVGGAVTGSAAGTMLFGFGFLVADWLTILAPTIVSAEPSFLSNLFRYSVVSCAFSLAGAGQVPGLEVGWRFLSPLGAAGVLLVYSLCGHALATLVARQRDV
jgi:ABC-type transport system involved in multi-copper enzyme maturation permease subunit